MHSLAGRNVLIADRTPFASRGIARYLRSAQARVLGPFPSVGEASRYLEAADLAVLDIHLGDESVFPLADQLVAAGKHFVFFTGLDFSGIPARFAGIPRLYRPVIRQRDRIGEAPARHVAISGMLPHLRLAARLLIPDSQAADRLVEATLTLAIADDANSLQGAALAAWLHRLMALVLVQRGSGLMN